MQSWVLFNTISLVQAFAFITVPEANKVIRTSTVGGVCDNSYETKLTTCGDELVKMGVFSSNGRQISFNDMKSRSQQYFVQMCSAYGRFNNCLGGTFIKTACYSHEPAKSKYAVVDAALEYICGVGYQSMLQNWDCYLSVAASQEINICEASFIHLATNGENMYSEYNTGTGACFALQTYVDCIRPSIEQSCGLGSFDTVINAIEKPVQVYLPTCLLSSAGSAHILTVIFAFIVSSVILF